MSAADSSNVDPTLLELFRAEVDIHLPVLSSGLLALEKGRADPKDVESMMRAAHSIKGAARIVGNEPAVRVAHVMEDCFTSAKEARVELSSDSVDVLLEGVDALQRICSPETDADISEESIQSVLQRIAALRDARSPLGAAANQTAGVAAASSSGVGALALPADFGDDVVEAIRVQLCGILARKPGRIGLDFSAVQQISVTAMLLLLSLSRQVKDTLPTSVVEALHVAPPIRAVFRVIGLENAFAVKD